MKYHFITEACVKSPSYFQEQRIINSYAHEKETRPSEL